MGINYWVNWALTIASEISAAVILLKFWYPHASDLLLSGSILLLILGFNVFSVKIYGEVEYALSFIKVATIIVFIILGGLIISGTPGHGIQNFHIGDAADIIGLGDVREFIHIEFADFQAARVFPRDFRERWGNHLARSAPLCPKIHQNRGGGL